MMLNITPSEQIDLAQCLSSGKSHYQANEYAQAILFFTQILNSNRSYSNALLSRAKAYFKSESYQEALHDLNEWIAQYPNDYRAIIYRGRTQVKLKEYKEAIDNFTKAFNLLADPQQRLVVLSHRAECYFRKDDLSNAFNDFITIYQNTPEKKLNVLVRLAQIYFNRKEYRQALEKLNIANKFDKEPNQVICTFFDLRSTIYYLLGQFEESQNDILELMHLQSTFSITYQFIYNNMDVKLVAENQGMTYTITKNGSSVALDELEYKPANNARPRYGQSAHTRFFKSQQGGSSDLVVKKHPYYYTKMTPIDDCYRNEAEIWNIMNHRYPAYFFAFQHTSCRLVLSRIPGDIFQNVHIHNQSQLIEYLQKWLSAALELCLLHSLNKVHGDLKRDNIIVYFDPNQKYFQATLIDYGNTATDGQSRPSYIGNNRSIHIAPELYQEDRYIVNFSSDVYSFSSEIIHGSAYTLPNHLITFFRDSGCAEVTSKRPSIESIMIVLWSEILQILPPVPDENNQLAVDVSKEELICNFIRYMELKRFKLFMNIIDKLEKNTQEQLLRHPKIVNAILGMHTKHEQSLPAYNGFVQQLLDDRDVLLRSVNQGASPAPGPAIDGNLVI